MKIRASVLVIAALISLSACGTLSPVYSISPLVRESARKYGEVMDEFTDQELLANVLRARDYAPLNFNDLASITGALSLSTTLGFAWPFGPFYGSRTGNSLGSYKDTFSPSFTGSSSPVINLGTLNTQGFMMTMVQPISTTYVLSKWNAYPHDLLLYLFVKSIRFPDERHVYRNDPDADADFADFQNLVSKMVDTTDDTSKNNVGGDVDMRAVNLLDPLGSPIPVGKSVISATPITSPTPTALPPPSVPTLTPQAVPGLAATTFYVRITYVTNSGESPASDEVSLQVTNNQGVAVQPPMWPTLPMGATVAGYNVYAATVSGAETRQNGTLVMSHATWNEQTTGLVVGSLVPGAPGTQYTVQSDYAIFQTISGLSDGQLHVGNKRCPTDVANGLHANDLCPPDEKMPFVQFYKEYPAQVVLCVRTGPDGLFDGHLISPMTDAEKQARQASVGVQHSLALLQNSLRELFSRREPPPPAEVTSTQSQINSLSDTLKSLQGKEEQEKARGDADVLMSLSSVMAKPQPSGGQPPGGGAPAGAGAVAPGGGGAAGTASSSGTGAMPLVTLALQPNRISALLHESGCSADQIVLHEETEEEFDRQNRQFTRIEWRSIAEVIQYLGSLARYEDGHKDKNGQGQPFEWQSPISKTTQRLFSYQRSGSGRLSVSYVDGDYTVPMAEGSGVKDHTLQVLSLLNELISIAKISGSLPVTQPVQVLP